MATSHKRKRIIAGALMSASAAMASLELQVPPTPELLRAAHSPGEQTDAQQRARRQAHVVGPGSQPPA